MAMSGSIEVIAGDESQGIAVKAATVEAVPLIVAAIYGLHNVTPVATAGGAAACWDAVDNLGVNVRVVLWPEPETPEPRPQPDESEA